MIQYIEENSKIQEYDKQLRDALISMYTIFKIVESSNELIKVANGK